MGGGGTTLQLVRGRVDTRQFIDWRKEQHAIFLYRRKGDILNLEGIYCTLWLFCLTMNKNILLIACGFCICRSLCPFLREALADKSQKLRSYLLGPIGDFHNFYLFCYCYYYYFSWILVRESKMSDYNSLLSSVLLPSLWFCISGIPAQVLSYYHKRQRGLYLLSALCSWRAEYIFFNFLSIKTYLWLQLFMYFPHEVVPWSSYKRWLKVAWSGKDSCRF
jgi:hypothetical protein